MYLRNIVEKIYATYEVSLITKLNRLVYSKAFFEAAEELTYEQYPNAEPWTDFYWSRRDKAEAFLLSRELGINYAYILFLIRQRDYGEGWVRCGF